MMWLLVADWCAMLAWLKTLDYGDVPTWASAVVSAAALGAAWFAARASWRVLTIETERDNDADERAQRAQADLIAAWLVNDRPYNWGAWNVCVANESKVPVYDVEVIVTSGLHSIEGDQSLTSDCPLVPPGQTLLPFPTLLTDLTAAEEISKTNPDLVSTESGVRRLHKVQITFNDAAGVRWVRSNLGTLTRVPPEGTSTERL